MNKNYFFISKPRCASTHIYEGLTNWDDKINGGKPYYHLTSEEIINIFKNKYLNSFSFSVIRNPYDLILSWYNEHKKDSYEENIKHFYSITLDEWIKKGCPTHWKHFKFNPLHQYKWIYNENNKLLVSYLIRLENYNNDIKFVYEKIKNNLPKNITIETILNTRKNESISSHNLSQEQKDIIYNLFKKDFELLGYSK